MSFAYSRTELKFQSTLPTRGSDQIALRAGVMRPAISIHAPHEGERLWTHLPPRHCGGYFNPRSPRGGATILWPKMISSPKFQSTLPTRGSDGCTISRRRLTRLFQSTLPTRGSDIFSLPVPQRVRVFQSTLPTRGSDPHPCSLSFLIGLFQSTLPTRGSDAVDKNHKGQGQDFNPRSPRGGATIIASDFVQNALHFNPRSPRGGATPNRRG